MQAGHSDWPGVPNKKLSDGKTEASIIVELEMPGYGRGDGPSKESDGVPFFYFHRLLFKKENYIKYNERIPDAIAIAGG